MSLLEKLKEKLLGGDAPESTPELAEAEDFIQKTADECRVRSPHGTYYIAASGSTAIRAFSKMPEAMRLQTVLALMSRLARRNDDMGLWHHQFAKHLLPKIGALTLENAEALARAASKIFHEYPFAEISVALLKLLNRQEPSLPIQGALKEAIEQWRNSATAFKAMPTKDWRTLENGLEALLLPQNVLLPFPHLSQNPVADALKKALTDAPESDAAAWSSFFKLCFDSENKSVPSPKWLKEAARLLQNVAEKWQIAALNAALQAGSEMLMQEHREKSTRDFGWHRSADVPAWLSPLIWYAGAHLSDSPDIRESLSELADWGFKKMPGVGSIGQKTGNACLRAFAVMPENRGIVPLLRLQKRVINLAIRKTVDKTLAELAAQNGLSTGELEEMSIPDFGLDAEGYAARDFGDYEAILSLDNQANVRIQWLQKSSGKALKSAPAALKDSHAAALKSLKLRQKEIADVLSSMSSRLESAYLDLRTWTLETLTARLLQHPVLRALAGRLIWQFEQDGRTEAAIFHEGRWQNPDGAAFDWLRPDATLRLWHPLASPPETVLAWRNWLIDNEVRQPFKQAFREIYVVTPPELNTLSYSNRFAAHIIRQHQFAALAKLRGWNYHLQGAWDSHNTPYRDVPNWEYRIEFWVESNWGADAPMSQSSIFNYVHTDQVRFAHQGRQVNMPDVPPLLFSELMRDVDLFVGVCSIGNDPNWQDTGDQRFRAYWSEYAFSESLTASGEVRLAALQRIIPRMKIAEKCHFEGKFLFVEGHRHLYKIHCGSGNILMSPNDRYLCIVPDQSKKAAGPGEIFLPFEGDTMLSIIISKAMLLADDDKITDSTILRQL